MYIRVWQDLSIEEIEKHLLIWGTLSGECCLCKHIGLNIEERRCPSCSTVFKYISLRENRGIFYVERIKNQRPDLIIIDWQDFSKQRARKKAKGFL